MMKLFYKTLIAAALLFSAASGELYASHFQGGDLTYQYVAPGTYVINAKIYRDCTGATAPASITLDIKPQGCPGSRSITVQQTGLPTIGNPYCPQIPRTCSTVRANQEEVRFSTTVTFTAAEQACTGGMIVSTTNNARTEIANLINPQGDLYLEAYLNLKPGINNSTAKINAVAPTVEYVCVGQETSLSLSAYDPDCDSLSYELVAPLSASNTPYAYAPITAGPSGYFANTNPAAPYCNNCTPSNPQFGFLPPGAPITNYSPTFPLVSYNANWNAINPATGIPFQFVPAYPYFAFNKSTGLLSFKPAVYHNAPTVQSNNNYAVVVKIKEWRKINGIMTNVGYTRRDMLFIVKDCGSNQNPEIAPLSVYPPHAATDTFFTVQAGATLNFQFATTDQPNDSIKIDSDVTTQLPGATFTQTSAAKPTGTINWTAPANNGTCGMRYFYIRVRDNACPIRGKKTYVIGVKVTNTGTATGLKEERNTELNFKAYPNPFSETVSFTSENFRIAKEIRIYNLLGQQIDVVKVSGNENEIRWEKASEFAAGTYVAKLITADNFVQTLKFTKLQ